MTPIEVRMGLYPDTVEKINRIQKVTSTQTKADALRQAVDLTLMIVDELEAGGHVFLVKSDESEYEIVMYDTVAEARDRLIQIQED